MLRGRASTSLNDAQSDEKSRPKGARITRPIQSKTDQLSQNFTIINKTKFPDTATKTAIGVVIFKNVVFAMLHSITAT
jgi:hypothetical protein